MKSYKKGKLHGMAQSFNEEQLMVFEAEYEEGKKKWYI